MLQWHHMKGDLNSNLLASTRLNATADALYKWHSKNVFY